MHLNKVLLAVIAALGVTTSAIADTNVGWYIAGDGGGHKVSTKALTIKKVTLVSRTETVVAGASSSSSSSMSSSMTSEGSEFLPAPELGQKFDFKSKHDFAGFARVGYRFSPHIRSELELGRREATLRPNIPVAAGHGNGRLTMDSAMINVLYDIAPEHKLHPFVGFGIGAVQMDWNYTENLIPSAPLDSQTNRIKARKTFGAYQGIAGLSWQISERVQFDVTYRYLEAPKARFENIIERQYTVQSECIECGEDVEAATVARVAHASADYEYPPYYYSTTTRVDEVYKGQLSGRVRDQSITVGLRYSFGQPRKPAPPMADVAPQAEIAPETGAQETQTPEPRSIAAPYGPPAPDKIQPRQFNIYFNFDSSRLGSDAQGTVNEAARYAVDNQATGVMVTGHADTSGSKAYNLALSKRRANVVADELADQGVPKPIITTSWMGENALVVPTRDGVPLRQNRRTTIDVNF